jgi:ribosomal protein S2
MYQRAFMAMHQLGVLPYQLSVAFCVILCESEHANVVEARKTEIPVIATS